MQNATGSVGDVVEKAKMPLVAGGAALAGLAGAAVVAAVSRSRRPRKVLGVSLPKRSSFSLPKTDGFKVDTRKVAGAVTDAANRADHLGQRVSRVASGVRQVSEAADQAAKKS